MPARRLTTILPEMPLRQGNAVAKGIKIFTSQRPAIQHQWNFGGMYFATADKLDPKVPFVKKEVRQAMNMAINRQAIADKILGSQIEPPRIMGYHRELDSAIWPGIWNPEWDVQFDTLYGYNPAKAQELLARAGYRHGFELTVYLYTLLGLPEILDIDPFSFVTYSPSPSGRGQADLSVHHGWSYGKGGDGQPSDPLLLLEPNQRVVSNEPTPPAPISRP
jgi:ABC-type transport system substrate-binding protein